MTVFAYSRLDGLLVALTVLDLTLTSVLIFSPHLPWPVLAVLFAITVFLKCTNFQCVAHNFLHNPFFTSRAANAVFGVVNSLGLGLPQSLYRAHHLNHHRFGSDDRDETTGSTSDHSSIYRYSNVRGQPEPLWRYALMGPLRVSLKALCRDVRRLRQGGQLIGEVCALVIAGAVLLYVRPLQFAAVGLPLWYAGWVAAHAENYLEHRGADPSDRRKDSVSCYGPIYNVLWFNNGFHQEHHMRPRVHWTRVRALRPSMLPDGQRHVVAGAHWINFSGGIR